MAHASCWWVQRSDKRRGPPPRPLARTLRPGPSGRFVSVETPCGFRLALQSRAGDPAIAERKRTQPRTRSDRVGKPCSTHLPNTGRGIRTEIACPPATRGKNGHASDLLATGGWESTPELVAVTSSAARASYQGVETIVPTEGGPRRTRATCRLLGRSR